MHGVHEDPSACTLRSPHHSSFLCARLCRLHMTPHASVVLHPPLAHALSCSLMLSLSLSSPPLSCCVTRFSLMGHGLALCDCTVERREAIQRLHQSHHQSLRSFPGFLPRVPSLLLRIRWVSGLGFRI